MGASEGHRVARDNARRVAKAVRRDERQPRGEVDRPTAPRIYQGSRLARSTAPIGPMIGSTPGQGPATLQWLSVAGGKPSVVALPAAITVFNITAARIAAGSLMVVASVDGQWVYDVTSCANGS